MTPIQQFLEIKKLSAFELEKKANLGNGLIGKAIKNKTNLSIETIEKIVMVFPDANKTFLRYGIGEILIKPLKTKQSELTGFLNSGFYILKDMMKPEPKRERIKNIIGELAKVYQYEEIYKRMGEDGKSGSKVFVGIKSPDLFISALVEKFNVNRDYIEKGVEPMFLTSNENLFTIIKELKENIKEKEERIKILLENNELQKELILALKKANKIGNKT